MYWDVLARQLLWVLLAVAPVWALLHFVRRRNPGWFAVALRWTAVVYSLGVAFHYGSLLFAYVAAPNYIRYEEPYVHSLALLHARGQALYPVPGDVHQYGGPYGPMLFIGASWVLRLFGSTQHVLKAFNALALAGSVIVLFTAVRRHTSPLIAAVSAALLCAFLSETQDIVLSHRGDGLILLCVSAALLVIHDRRTAPLAAIAAAVAINVKIHSVLYFIPILAFAAVAHGTVMAIGCCLLATLATAMPWMLSNISLANYVTWLRVAALLRPSALTFAENLCVVVYLAAPLAFVTAMRNDLRPRLRPTTTIRITALLLASVSALLLMYKPGRSWAGLLRDIVLRPYFVLIMFALVMVVAIVWGMGVVARDQTLALPMQRLAWCAGPAAVLVCLVASKPGAGYWHLVPFAVTMLLLAALVAANLKAVQRIPLAAMTIAFAFAAATTGWRQAQIVRAEIRTAGTPADVKGDIEEILRRHDGLTIQMGYGGFDPDTEESYALSYYRPMLVARGFPYLLDPVSVEATNAVNMPIPQTTIATLGRCETQMWLIPRGRPPFLLRSRYNRSSLFDGFREEFLRTHELRGRSRYFDLWSCRGSKVG